MDDHGALRRDGQNTTEDSIGSIQLLRLGKVLGLAAGVLILPGTFIGCGAGDNEGMDEPIADMAGVPADPAIVTDVALPRFVF